MWSSVKSGSITLLGTCHLRICMRKGLSSTSSRTISVDILDESRPTSLALEPKEADITGMPSGEDPNPSWKARILTEERLWLTELHRQLHFRALRRIKSKQISQQLSSTLISCPNICISERQPSRTEGIKALMRLSATKKRSQSGLKIQTTTSTQ